MRVLAFALLWLLMGCATAREPPIAEAAALEDRFPKRSVRYPGGIVAEGDVIYDVVPGYRPLSLDIYTPARHDGPRPLVVYVHGGAWMGGHSRQAGALADFPSTLATLAARGYVVASVNYRLSGEARFPAALRDVSNAIRWLRANAARLGIDPARVAAWGSSAGGQLAALAALACGAPELEGAAPAAGECVQGAVLWYPSTDFTTVGEQAGPALGSRHVGADAPPAGYLGCAIPACDADLLRRASVTSHVDRGDPPVLMIHGTGDEVVPWRQSQQLADRLQEAGVAHELLLLDGIGHSFIGADAAATRAATLKALDRTQAFLDRVLGGAAPGRGPSLR